MPIFSDDEIYLGNETQMLTDQERIEIKALTYDDTYIDVDAPNQIVDRGFRSTMAAALRTENSAVSWMVNMPFAPFQEQEGYNPFADDNELLGYEGFADAFVDSVSPEHTKWIKTQIDREQEDRRFLESQGWEGFLASTVAGTVDPITLGTMLIPGGGITKGGSALMSALKVGVAGAAGSTATELALHQSQNVRTFEESAVNVFADSLLGGLLGGGAQLLTNSQRKALTSEVSQHVRSVNKPRSVGAAEVFRTTLDQETMKAAGLSKTASVSPIGRVLQSPSKMAREIGQRLAENNFTFKKNEEGIPTPQAAETNIKRWDAVKFKQHQVVTDQYTAYKKRIAKMQSGKMTPEQQLRMTPTSEKLQKADAPKAMSRLEFNAAIGKAMRRNDMAFTPEVHAAAKELRKVYSSTAQELVDLGLLEPEMLKMKTAPSYVNRVYDFEKIRNERTKFSNIISNWLMEQDRIAYHKSQEQIELLRYQGLTETELLTDPKYTQLIHDRMSKLEADDAANTVINKILGAPSGMVEEAGILPEGIVGKAGVLKERTLTIPDDMIEEFLESDITLVMDRYIDQLAPEIELTKAFGSKDMRQAFVELNEDYNELILKETDSKKIKKLEKARENDIRDLEAMRDILIGTYGQPADPGSMFIRAGRVMRNVNFLRLLGGMTISAIPDLARPIMQHGLRNSSAAAIKFATADGALKRMALDELKEIGVGLDFVLSTRKNIMANLDSVQAPKSAIENGLDKLSNHFGNLTLMNQWNDLLKNWSGLVVQNRVIKVAEKIADGGRFGKGDKAALARLGLSKSDLIDIAEQYRKHGESQEGLRFGRSHMWDDDELRARYQTAILKDVDSVVVTPGAGDIPLMMKGEVGKTIMQFKTFLFGAHNRMLVAGFQQGDVHFYTGLLMSIGLGALTYNAKQAAAGRPIDNSWNNLVKEGIDRSGVLGWMSEPLATTEKMSGGRIGLGAMFGTGQVSRYASRNTVGALLGPSFDLSGDIVTITSGVMQGEWNEAQTRAVRKMLPYQNLFYVRPILNEVESEFNK